MADLKEAVAAGTDELVEIPADVLRGLFKGLRAVVKVAEGTGHQAVGIGGRAAESVIDELEELAERLITGAKEVKDAAIEAVPLI